MKLKKSDISKILEFRRRGTSIDEIAKIFGVSKRRIQQILKDPKLGEPGRKKIKVPQEIGELVIRLRKEGYTIDEIQQRLSSEGYKLSRYMVWKILKEHRIKIFREILNEFTGLCSSVNSVFFIGVSPTILCEDKRKLKILIVCNVRECKVVYCGAFEKLTLKDIISVFDSIVLKDQKPDLVVLFPTPPLVPTRDSGNKLVNHLKNLGISYIWFPEQLKDKCKEEVELLKNLLKRKCDCSYLIFREIRNRCKELLEVSKNEGAKSDKEISKNQDNCRNKKF